MRYFLLSSLASLVLVTPTLAWQPTSDHPWPMFHGNYNHTGFSNVEGPREGKLKWKVKVGSGEENSPPPNSIAVVADKTVYVASAKGVYALHPKRGKVKWSKKYSNVQGPALSTDGKTLYLAGNNSLLALKTKNGAKRWKYAMGNRTLFGPTIGPDGTIYQGSWDGYLYAVKPNGKLKWKYQTNGAISYPVSINKKGTIYIGGGDTNAPDSLIYALKPDGTLKWTYDTGVTRVGSPAISKDQTLYFPASPTLFALSKTGELLWTMGPDTDESEDDGSDDDNSNEPQPGDEGEQLQQEEANDDIAGIITPAIGPDGTIYIGNSQGVIIAINPTTQEVLWTYQTGPDPDDVTIYGLPSFPVVDKDGVSYFGSVDKKMYALDSDGTLLWSYETGGEIAEAAPALDANGTLYFSSADGYVYAIAK